MADFANLQTIGSQRFGHISEGAVNPCEGDKISAVLSV
jgi:hypothetical protein